MNPSSKKNKRRAADLMPELVWLPTYVGLLVVFLWVSKSGETLFLIPILFLCIYILENIYKCIFGEKRRDFLFLVATFIIQCIAWILVVYFGIFPKT
jgi:hypothetical protein